MFGVRGIWKRGGWGEGWVKRSQFTSNLRPRWTDPVTARRVPSKWRGVKKGTKGKAKKNQQGESEARGNAPCTLYIVIRVLYVM